MIIVRYIKIIKQYFINNNDICILEKIGFSSCSNYAVREFVELIIKRYKQYLYN